jgi:hypothetical protein
MELLAPKLLQRILQSRIAPVPAAPRNRLQFWGRPALQLRRLGRGILSALKSMKKSSSRERRRPRISWRLRMRGRFHALRIGLRQGAGRLLSMRPFRSRAAPRFYS